MFRSVTESQTLLINSQSKSLLKAGKKIYTFGFGQSPFPPPQKAIESLQSAATEKTYSDVQGDYLLRENIGNFHQAHNGLYAPPEHIYVAPGSKILLFNILLAFEKADVLIPAPAWVSYAPQAQLIGHHCIRLTSSYEERWRITPELLEKGLRQKKCKQTVLILNYPGNPDGLTYSENEIIALTKMAKKHHILVISDEIYGLLTHKRNHISFANFYPERTITTTGLSKWCGAGGWRLGAALLSEGISTAFKKTFVGIASETYSCAPSPVQVAAVTAYEDYGALSSYLKYQNNILHTIGSYCQSELSKIGVKIHLPEGGFYLFPDFTAFKDKLSAKTINTSNKLCEQLLQDTGVALLPASAFGFEESFFSR